MSKQCQMIRAVTALVLCLLLVDAAFAEPAGHQSTTIKPIALEKGPHLLLDDYLIAKSEGVERKVIQPQRFLEEPVVTSRQDHQNWQPWLTVLQDPGNKRFRMWYNADTVDDPAERPDAFGPVLGYLESADGIHWPGPYRRLQKIDSILFGGSVVDDGPACRVPAERYKVMYYSSRVQGPVVAFSPDGLQWTMHNEGKPVLFDPVPDDSWHATWDPIRKRYMLIGKESSQHTWTNAEGNTITKWIRRYGVSYSDDFKTWSDLKIVFSPDEKDPGVTEWYAGVGFLVRGDLIVAFLQVLRDDLTAEGAPKEAIACNMGNVGAGMGHTVLAWTRDGETWHRDRQKDALLEPVPQVGAWDHAMAWVCSAVPVDDEVYLYYAGYRWGHKYQRSLDRQIGLVKIKQDRYVARKAGDQQGTLTTPLLTVDADHLTLNTDAQKGEVRVQVLDAESQPIPGLTFADCKPIAEDSLRAPVAWKTKSLKDVMGKPLRLEFAIKTASLFAFELQAGSNPTVK
jgi:hypothetical protein